MRRTFTRRFLHCAQPLRDFFEPSCVIFGRVDAHSQEWRPKLDSNAVVESNLREILLAWFSMVHWLCLGFCKFRGAGDDEDEWRRGTGRAVILQSHVTSVGRGYVFARCIRKQGGLDDGLCGCRITGDGVSLP
jgi:hypothetical protein